MVAVDAPAPLPQRPVPTGTRLAAHTMRGCITLIVPSRIVCGSCGLGLCNAFGESVASAVRGCPVDHIDTRRWWPATVFRVSTVIYVRVLRMLLAVKEEKPNIGNSALLAVLRRLATALSGRSHEAADFTAAIRRITAEDAFREFRYLEYELDRYRGVSHSRCAICRDAPSVLCADACVKLCRRESSGDGVPAMGHGFGFST